MSPKIDYELPKIHNQSLLELALTHRSYINEHPEVTEHNERLEFLGDALLGFLVGELLYGNKKLKKQPQKLHFKN